MNNAIATAATTVHPFEARGLGQAPFRFVGMGQQDRCYGEVILNRAEYERTGISLTTKPGGTCAYCGQGITNLYNIRSADGKTFHVGCDCVALTGDAKLMTVVKKAALKLAREQRQARAATKAEQLAAILADDAHRARLAALPHPRGRKGESLLTWAEWMAKHVGAAGTARVLKAIRA